MSALKLKPCPFCAGAAIISRESMDERMGYISVTTVLCAECGARVHASDGMDENGWVKDVTSEPKAITAWNTRTPTISDALALPEVKALVEAAKVTADRNKFANPMRSADMHKGNCQCARCHYDVLDAALDALSTPPADGDKP